MKEDELAAIASLKAAGNHTAAHARATDLARAWPGDVRVQMAAAYACDRLGLERDAIAYYERAWELGVPTDERAGFLVGFGSTLRNVGRTDEAVARLAEASVEFPNDAALRAFLALALHSAGHGTLALATMLEAALAAARPDGFGPYRRALAEYQAELVTAAIGDQPPQ
ncbi:MAG TPA: tetratricopeptide repeat protein [Kofleriaceae bacterium]|nr:tetratricopeptide repeat protein [Kofleriaceae bacterium]